MNTADSMKQDALRERIRKLLNMTEANGCTEDEADNAMRMASGLAAKLGIELDSLRPAGSPKPKISRKSAHKAMKIHESFCAKAAAIMYGVRCDAPNHGKHGFYYTGRDENIEMAEQTMLWLIRQVELLYKQALPKGLSQRQRAEFRASFKDACAQRVYNRANTMMYDLRNNEVTAQAATGSNALVVKGHFDKLNSEIDDYLYGTDEERAERHKAAMEQAERWREQDRIWRENNPEEAARLDKEAEREAKKWARQDARRSYSAPRTRQPKHGSGSDAGRQAGDRVQLRKEIN